jgi:hypothetical protein
MSPTKTILIIDDEEEFREAAVELTHPLLTEDWEIQAPDTLDKAMQIIHERLVRVALIDRNINSNGYQKLAEGSQEYENVSGIEVATWIEQQFPSIRRIAYSKGGLGCAQFNGHVNDKFPLKQFLRDSDAQGKHAQEAFRELIEREIRLIEAKSNLTPTL